MAKTLTIKTRDELGRYLQRQAEEMISMAWGRSVLRELVDEAYKFEHRLPRGWSQRAKKALRDIKD